MPLITKKVEFSRNKWGIINIIWSLIKSQDGYYLNLSCQLSANRIFKRLPCDTDMQMS